MQRPEGGDCSVAGVRLLRPGPTASGSGGRRNGHELSLPCVAGGGPRLPGGLLPEGVSGGSAGLPRDHPESYHSFMWNNFFKHTDTHPENTHILGGNAADLQAECDALEGKPRLRVGLSCLWRH